MTTPTCVHCGAAFDPALTVGQWHCRRHLGHLQPHSLGARYSCCGLIPDMVSARAYHTLSAADRRGCTPCDHEEEEEEDSSSVYIVRWASARDTQRPGFVRAVRDADVGRTLTDLDPSLPDLVRAAISATYANPAYWQTLPPKLVTDVRRIVQARLQNGGLDRVMTWRPRRVLSAEEDMAGDGAEEADAAEEGAEERAMALELAARRVPVTVSVFRTRASAPDPETVKHIRTATDLFTAHMTINY